MARKFLCNDVDTVVQTKAGKLKGFLLDDIYTFYGIKYADAKRWQMPTPVEPWDGIKNALAYSYCSPMLAQDVPYGNDQMVPHRYWPMNEHCQYLNIWTQSLCKDAKKPVIVCGDLNVAHHEIDLKNPSSNRGNAGFSDEERESFTKLLEAGFTDTFRFQNPDKTGAYSWWSYRFNARKNNAGWRIDYFLVSNRLAGKINATPIYSDILGSDHCPVGLELDI